ncbi:succinate dehydrogenase, hydrophobic membrane anchor protein [Rickettsia endosymbiont of Cardiosporidium cionae]|uniref:succinate dehydrogenase, hydrophobic membrane anchor protein n=1 Tax=Rickettsia endosymbiont of Cardiosporidium cionae TaxID=2777155 RepID=UPI00389A6D4B
MHWLSQRITSILMIPVIFTACILVLKIIQAKNLTEIVFLIQEPANIMIVIVLVILIFYHGYLGIRIIIEDYIQSNKLRSILLMHLLVYSIMTPLCLVLAIIYNYYS